MKVDETCDDKQGIFIAKALQGSFEFIKIKNIAVTFKSLINFILIY